MNIRRRGWVLPVIAVGLWLIDVTMGGGQGGFRTALLAGLICAVMRYIPYIGVEIGVHPPGPLDRRLPVRTEGDEPDPFDLGSVHDDRADVAR